jgi:aspartate ammonia-lyase
VQPAKTRIEHDLLGDRAVPAEAYFGVHTLRAVENFPITGNPISIYPDLIRALACIKEAAALANHALGMLAPRNATRSSRHAARYVPASCTSSSSST